MEITKPIINKVEPFRGYCQTVVNYKKDSQGNLIEIGVAYSNPLISWAEYQIKHPACALIEWPEFEELVRLRNLELGSQPFKEINEETWDDALNCMPPLRWLQTEGIESFFICEALTGNIHSMYTHLYGRYFSADRPINCDRKAVRTEIMSAFFGVV